MIEALVIVLAYLWGAIPTSYIVARVVRGIDLRRYGSGNVGASNVMVHLGMKVGLLLGAADCLAKGTLPVVLVRLLDMSAAAQVGVGLAAVAGHNWSPYIGFTGGRGMATAMGVLLGFLAWPDSLVWPELVVLAVVGGLLGRVLRNVALWMGIGFLLVPVVAAALKEPEPVLWLSLGIVGILALKRLTANWERLAAGEPMGRVLLNRLLHDRDIADREAWLSGQRGEGEGH